mmetsp:Transcript_4024/g.9681  ORF Transcript_4024/g.9681 Transcript_4024/m.9681 type:complete len:219 (+) Transcript_4024:3878-4534(+)
MVMEMTGGGSLSTLSFVAVRWVRTPRNVVATTEMLYSRLSNKRLAGTEAVSVVCDARCETSASPPSQLSQRHANCMSRTLPLASAVNAAASHRPISFGPSTTTSGACGAAGAVTAKVKSPDASDTPSSVRSSEPSSVTLSPGTIVAPLPRTTPKRRSLSHRHCAPGPRRSALAVAELAVMTSEHASKPTTALEGTSSETRSVLPMALKTTDTSCGARR